MDFNNEIDWNGFNRDDFTVQCLKLHIMHIIKKYQDKGGYIINKIIVEGNSITIEDLN